MKGDFTRTTFKREKHYSSVRQQQGRVQLDADWNEQLDLTGHRVETEAIDVIGVCGAPKHNAGFGVITDVTPPTPEQQPLVDALAGGDFLIGKGRYYVDGIMCENDNYVAFTTQPDLPGVTPVAQAGIYVAYIDVWQRHITAIEDPPIREVALGGPDTATRTKTVWQIKLSENLAGNTPPPVCSDDLKPWQTPPGGKLFARATPGGKSDDPCVVAPGAGYRRLENQLYRVEVHKGTNDAGGPTYKWSRDNGSVAVAVEEFNFAGDAKKLKVKSLGRDHALGLRVGDWVEVLDDATDLLEQMGTLAQIEEVDTEQKALTLSIAVPNVYDLKRHPKVRRWDSDGEAAVADAQADFVELEDGVEIKFETGFFKTGDYWLIPARTVPGKFGDVEWPRDSLSNPLAQLPEGIKHHYCKIAIITFQDGADGIEITAVEDCRPIFPPLTELPAGGASCCEVTVGEGGDFATIQAAVNNAEDGTRICILSGEYKLADTVVIEDKRNLIIIGCGQKTKIIGPDLKSAFAIIDGCMHVTLESLSIEPAAFEPGIVMKDSKELRILNCDIVNRMVEGATWRELAPLIAVDACEDVRIADNRMLQNSGMFAITLHTVEAEIEDNLIEGGGVLLHDKNRLVTIQNNKILVPADGKDRLPGPGIQLGVGSAQESPSPITGVRILDNSIAHMGGSGITTAMAEEGLTEFAFVEDLLIAGNHITRCVQKEPVKVLGISRLVAGGIILHGASAIRIYDNRIDYNGAEGFTACGIFMQACASIEVIRNIVIDNGLAADVEGDKKALQGGIIAYMVYGVGSTAELKDGESFTEDDAGVPALRVHDNLVRCPAGRALLSLAMGPVSVIANTLISLGASTPIIYGHVGACALIHSLGVSEFPQGFGVAGDAQGVSNTPDGRVMFHDNQVTLRGEMPSIGEWPVGPNRQMEKLGPGAVAVASLDDVSLEGNQVRAQVTGHKILANVTVQATTARATGNRFTETPFSAYCSYYGKAEALNVTTSNEATHCILTEAPINHKMANAEMMQFILGPDPAAARCKPVEEALQEG